MSNSKISALTGATTPLAGTEVLPVVQSGVTKQVSVANLTAGRSVNTGALTVDGLLASKNYQTLGTQASAGAGAAISFIPSSTLTNWLVGANYSLSGVFEITPSTAGGGSTFTTPILTAISTGDVNVKVGNLVIGTSGKGIDFSATPGTGTSELLADYEEGTWTPNQGGGLTVVGAFTSSGRYTKIGRFVQITGVMEAGTSIAITAGGIISSNLPFNSTSYGEGIVSSYFLTSGAIIQPIVNNLYGVQALAASRGIQFAATYYTT